MVGVSQDSQARNDEFRKTLDLPYPLVGDPEGTILRGYDVRWPIVGLAQRITYVVGRDQRIKVAFHAEFDIDAHMAKACEVLAAPAP